MLKSLIIASCIISFASFVIAEATQPVVIDIGGCGPGFENSMCEVHQVQVDCEIERNSKACRLKRGLNYTLEMDFTPEFEGSDLTLLAYALLPGADAEFQGMDDNACNWMKCPVEKGAKQTYTFRLSMKPSYPKGVFNVRWHMKKEGITTCCFVNKFKIE